MTEAASEAVCTEPRKRLVLEAVRQHNERGNSYVRAGHLDLPIQGATIASVLTDLASEGYLEHYNDGSKGTLWHITERVGDLDAMEAPQEDVVRPSYELRGSICDLLDIETDRFEEHQDTARKLLQDHLERAASVLGHPDPSRFDTLGDLVAWLAQRCEWEDQEPYATNNRLKRHQLVSLEREIRAALDGGEQ